MLTRGEHEWRETTIRYDMVNGYESIGDAEPALTGDTSAPYVAPEQRELIGDQYDGVPRRQDAPTASRQTRGPGYSTQKVLGSDDRGIITDTLQAPFSTVVATFQKWPNGQVGVCSGMMVGPRSVLTAGHCIHNNEHGGWAQMIRVVPGLAGRYMPFGSAYSTHLSSVTGWTVDEDDAVDYGLITLDRDIGLVSGYSALCSLSDALWHFPNIISVMGYPGISNPPPGFPDPTMPLAERWLATAASNISGLDNDVVKHTIDTSPGQSGGPLGPAYSSKGCAVVKGYYSDFWVGDHNYATRINNERFNRIQGWIATDASLPKIEVDPFSTYYGWKKRASSFWLRQAPAVIKTNDGVPYHAFYRDSNDGAIYHTTLNSSGNTISANMGVPFAPQWGAGWVDKFPIAAVSRQTEYIDLFVRSPGGALYSKAWDGTQWKPSATGWWTIDSTNKLMGSLITYAPSANKIVVWGQATDGYPVWKIWTGSGGWTGWSRPAGSPFIGSQRQEGAISAVTLSSSGTQYVFIRRDDSTIQLYSMTTTGASQWTDLGRPPGPWGGPPVAVASGPSEMYVFMATLDGVYWFRKYVNGSWTVWVSAGSLPVPLGRDTSDDNRMGLTDSTLNFSVVSRGTGILDLFATDPNGVVFSKSYINGWNPPGNWWSLQGKLLSVSAVSSDVNRIDLIGRTSGLDGEAALVHKYWTSTAGWSTTVVP